MLRWILSALSRLDPPKEDAPDPWLKHMRQAERYLDAGKFGKAEAVLRPLLSSPEPDERRLHTLYTLGIALGEQGSDGEASGFLEEAFELTRAVTPEDTGRLVSTLRNWLLSLERTGRKDEAAHVEAQLREYTDRRIAELWTVDDDNDDRVHLPTTIRFPGSFGALRRGNVGFDSPNGFDGWVVYTPKPPCRGKVIVEVAVTDRSPKQGLIELSNEAVAMLGLDGADYSEGTFRAGLETAPTGIRRLWPFFDVDGESWNLETFFVARGRIHVCIFKTCPPGDTIEIGESLEQMLAQFDWPAPD